MKDSLKKTLIISLLIPVIGYCGKEKSLTPAEVLERTKTAYENKDAKVFLKGLSNKIVERMEGNLSAIRMTFSRLSDNSRKGIAEKMNVSPSSLSKLTLEEYTEYQIKTEQMGLGRDSILFPVKYLDLNSISDISANDGVAVITFSENRVLKMIEEETGWKIDSIQISPENSEVVDSEDKKENQEN